MRGKDAVELLSGDAGGHLQCFDVLGWRAATDLAVGPRREGGLVDDALSAVRSDLVLVAPGLREDVVDVDGKVEKRRHVHWLPEGPVHASFAHEQRIDTLVGGAVPGAQGQQPRGLEASLRDGDGLGPTITDPRHNLFQVAGEACLGGPSVQLTEYPAPIPAAQLDLVTRKCGGQQFEHVEGHAAGIDLLEDGADRFLGRGLLQHDDRDRVADDVVEHLLKEVIPPLHARGIPFGVDPLPLEDLRHVKGDP